jgi:hypothetical protein
MSDYNCPKCEREYWGVYRRRTITEYRIVDSKSSVDGDKKYKGNWKTEETTQSKTLGLYCLACSHETEGEDIDGCSGIKIKSKGVTFISDFWDKYTKKPED